MDLWTGICMFLVALPLANRTVKEAVLEVQAERLRLEIARHEASLDERRKHLQVIEKQLGLTDSKLGVSSTPPLALDGFCPVALSDKSMWKQGKANIVRVYDGLSYRFSNKRAARTFDGAPFRYALVMQGDDVVVAMNQSVRVAGRRDYGGRWQERTYLFESGKSYETFQQTPERFAAFARGIRPQEAEREGASGLLAGLSDRVLAKLWDVRDFLESGSRSKDPAEM